MLDSAAELEVPLPLTSLTRQLFQAAIATGHGDEDICSTIKVLEGLPAWKSKAKARAHGAPTQRGTNGHKADGGQKARPSSKSSTPKTPFQYTLLHRALHIN